MAMLVPTDSIPESSYNFHYFNATIKHEDENKTDEPTYSISVYMISVHASRSKENEVIVDEDKTGQEHTIYFENIPRHEIATIFQEWLWQNEVQLEGRENIGKKIENILRQCSINCYFSFQARIEYDVDKSMNENRSSASDKKEGETCAICLENYNAKNFVNLLVHCNHGFHYHCIMNWMETNNSCPLCRKPVLRLLY